MKTKNCIILVLIFLVLLANTTNKVIETYDYHYKN